MNATMPLSLQALKALFELASTATVVDHPLCLDCAAQLKEEVEAQVAETEREIAAYSEALARLEAEPAQTLIEVLELRLSCARMLTVLARTYCRGVMLSDDCQLVLCATCECACCSTYEQHPAAPACWF